MAAAGLKRTGIKRGTSQLQRRIELKRFTPIKQRSEKKMREDREFARNRQRRKRLAKGACEMKVTRLCTGVGVEAHHVLRRAQHVDHSVENLRMACGFCHSWVHANPKRARELGFLASGHVHFKERPAWRK